MTVKEITFDEEARRALLQGVKKFARAVKTTLGPRGRYAIIDRGWGAPKLTKDGASVAEEVELSNPVEDMAARLMRETATKTSGDAGDGSTTSTVLAEAIFTRAMRSVLAGANPLLVQRGLSKATQRVVKALDEMSIEVEGSQIPYIAAIAANNDRAIGKTIAEAMRGVGQDGMISITEGKGMDTVVEMVKGMQFDRGYLSQYFVTDDASAKVILENPYILILEDKVSNLAQILPIMEKVLQKHAPLLIVADDIEGEALSTLVVNMMRNVMKCAACKAPGYGERRKEMLRDLAVATGARAIFKDLGLDPDSISISDLGRAKRVELTSDTTTVIQGAGTRQATEERVALIRRELEKVDSDYDREKLQERLARLVGGIAEIQVGGATETEVKEKKKRFENALSATRSAVAEGILPGGGVALINCSRMLETARVRDADEKQGIKILKAALQAPFRQLAKNAGEEPSRILRRIRAQEEPHFGFDFEKRRDCDLLSSGIIDACRVTKLALQNANSVAGVLFTSGTVVTDLPREEAEPDEHHDH
ncbi:MAG: chaperonin GroEL, partial [Planctomycetota bacterium]